MRRPPLQTETYLRVNANTDISANRGLLQSPDSFRRREKSCQQLVIHAFAN